MISFLISAIKYACVFIFGATGEILIEKSGHLNLGIPGIMCFGAVGGCLGANIYVTGLNGAAPVASMTVFVALVFALLFGAIMGLIYGFMTITLRCNQNVTGLTITTFGIGIFNYWVKVMGSEGVSFSDISALIREPLFGEGSGWFYDIFLSYGPFIYLAILIAIISAIVLKKTRTGLNLNAIGENPGTADAAGINVNRYKYVTCILGSGIAAIGGVYCILDIMMGSIQYPLDALGWLAVALVIFSIWKPHFAIVGSFIFAALYITPNHVVVSSAYAEIVKMVPYLVTLVVLIITSIINKRETQPPAALGTSYFREDR